MERTLTPLPRVPPPLSFSRGGGAGRHLVNPKFLLGVTVFSRGSVCCEALPLVSPVLCRIL